MRYTCDRAGFRPDNPVIICEEGLWKVYDEATGMSTGSGLTTGIDERPACNGEYFTQMNI